MVFLQQMHDSQEEEIQNFLPALQQLDWHYSILVVHPRLPPWSLQNRHHSQLFLLSFLLHSIRLLVFPRLDHSSKKLLLLISMLLLFLHSQELGLLQSSHLHSQHQT